MTKPEAVTDSETGEAVETAMQQARLPKKMNVSPSKLKEVRNLVQQIKDHAIKVSRDPETGGPRIHHLKEITNFIAAIGRKLAIK